RNAEPGQKPTEDRGRKAGAHAHHRAEPQVGDVEKRGGRYGQTEQPRRQIVSRNSTPTCGHPGFACLGHCSSYSSAVVTSTTATSPCSTRAMAWARTPAKSAGARTGAKVAAPNPAATCNRSTPGSRVVCPIWAV